MPLLFTISNPTMNLITKGEMTEALKKQLANDTWLSLMSVSDEVLTLRISCITAVQEISEQKRIEWENAGKSVIQKPGFSFAKPPPN